MEIYVNAMRYWSRMIFFWFACFSLSDWLSVHIFLPSSYARLMQWVRDEMQDLCSSAVEQEAEHNRTTGSELKKRGRGSNSPNQAEKYNECNCRRQKLRGGDFAIDCSELFLWGEGKSREEHLSFLFYRFSVLVLSSTHSLISPFSIPALSLSWRITFRSRVFDRKWGKENGQWTRVDVIDRERSSTTRYWQGSKGMEMESNWMYPKGGKKRKGVCNCNWKGREKMRWKWTGITWKFSPSHSFLLLFSMWIDFLVFYYEFLRASLMQNGREKMQKEGMELNRFLLSFSSLFLLPLIRSSLSFPFSPSPLVVLSSRARCSSLCWKVVLS